jgi:hypothetical protein
LFQAIILLVFMRRRPIRILAGKRGNSWCCFIQWQPWFVPRSGHVGYLWWEKWYWDLSSSVTLSPADFHSSNCSTLFNPNSRHCVVPPASLNNQPEKNLGQSVLAVFWFPSMRRNNFSFCWGSNPGRPDRNLVTVPNVLSRFYCTISINTYFTGRRTVWAGGFCVS